MRKLFKILLLMVIIFTASAFPAKEVAIKLYSDTANCVASKNFICVLSPPSCFCSSAIEINDENALKTGLDSDYKLKCKIYEIIKGIVKTT